MIGNQNIHAGTGLHADHGLHAGHGLGVVGGVSGHTGAGILVVRIIEAVLTHNTEIINKMDPYVFMKHRDVTQRTSVRKRAGKHPVWDQSFRFEILSPLDEIEFFVMDKDTFTKDDVIGWVTVSAQRLLEAAGQPCVYQLQYKKGYAGELEIEAHLEGGHGIGQAYPTAHNTAGVVYPTGATTAYTEHTTTYQEGGLGHAHHQDQHAHDHLHGGQQVINTGTYVGDTRHLAQEHGHGHVHETGHGHAHETGLGHAHETGHGHGHTQVHEIEKVTTYTGAEAQNILNAAQHNPTSVLEPTLLNERGYGHTGEVYQEGHHAHAGHVQPGVYTGAHVAPGAYGTTGTTYQSTDVHTTSTTGASGHHY